MIHIVALDFQQQSSAAPTSTFNTWRLLAACNNNPVFDELESCRKRAQSDPQVESVSQSHFGRQQCDGRGPGPSGLPDIYLPRLGRSSPERRVASPLLNPRRDMIAEFWTEYDESRAQALLAARNRLQRNIRLSQINE
jgi:hypothetical protein